MVSKTWANSWSTTERYHEEQVLPCIFGCRQYRGCEAGAKDSLGHYLDCPILWLLLYSVLRTPSFSISAPGAKLACLSRHSLNDLRRLCLAFKCYHALRMGHPKRIIKAVKSSLFDDLHVQFLNDLAHFANDFALCHLYDH